MIKNSGYVFDKIHDRVNAAENLQRAGQDSDAKKVLEDLAHDILLGA